MSKADDQAQMLVCIIVVVASHANPFVRDQNQFDF